MGKHTKESKKMKKKRHIGRKIFLFLLLVIIVAGVVFAKRVYDLDGNWLAALMGHNKHTIENLGEIKILIMGESTGMSDTLIVAKYNPKTGEASLLSIPRDTYTGDVKENAKYYQKINSLYSHGETPEKTIEAVNKITGLDVEKYILVDTKALRELVDIIGAVEFDVPIDMKYDDDTQNLHFDLKKGYQKLNGDQAEQVSRFRHNNNGSTYPSEYGMEDYGRMRTQRNLIIAIAKQTIKVKNITEIGKIIDTMKNNIKTNLDLNVMKDYIPYAVKIDLNSIETAQLPGISDKVNGVWFFFHNKKETKEIVDKLFNNIEDTESSGNNKIANTVAK